MEQHKKSVKRIWILSIAGVLLLCILASSLFVRYEPNSQLEALMSQATTVKVLLSVGDMGTDRVLISQLKIRRLAREISDALIEVTDPGFQLSDFDGGSSLILSFYRQNEQLCLISWQPRMNGMENLLLVSFGSSQQWYLWSGSEMLERYYQSLLLQYEAERRAYWNE